MRKFKTSEDNRTNYIYYTAEGKKLVIKPGMVGNDGKAITEEMITILHKMDDEQVDADRREEYHCPVHYQAYSDGEGEDADDRNPYLCDTAADNSVYRRKTFSQSKSRENRGGSYQQSEISWVYLLQVQGKMQI